MPTSRPEVVWVVVPFSREKNLARVLANFQRQSFRGKRLVIVENGPAIGACARAGVTPDLLLTSGPHQSLAKNEAMAELRRRGGGYWTTFDDDDWYGRHHVQEIADNAHRATVCGRGEHFVRLADGLHLFRSTYANRFGRHVAGPTISARVEDTIPFREFSPGDTPDWCGRMLAAGATFWNCDFRHFVYYRLGRGHVWEADDIAVRCAYGDALFFGDAPDELVELAALPPAARRPRPTTDELFAYLEAWADMSSASSAG